MQTLRQTLYFIAVKKTEKIIDQKIVIIPILFLVKLLHKKRGVHLLSFNESFFHRQFQEQLQFKLASIATKKTLLR